MLAPGKNYPGSAVRVAINLEDETDTDTDPATIKFTYRSPLGVETTYTYGTDAALVKDSTGDYHVDVVPDIGGRWRYRWLTSGTNKTIALEGSFLVQTSRFNGWNDSVTPAYTGWWWWP